MANEVKWIRITSDIFDNLKIKHIKAVPELGHALVCVWFEILCMAGTCNSCGMLTMNNNLPITEELIAEAFNEDIKLVQMALRMFQEMGMIEISENNCIQISNWYEYQSEEGLETIRKYQRENKAKYRKKQEQKQIELKEEKCPRTMSYDKSVDKSEDSSLSISISYSYSYSKSKSNIFNLNSLLEDSNYINNSNYKEYILHISNNERLLETLRRWLSYKDERKDKYAESSILSLIKKFVTERDNNDEEFVAEVVENSILNNYKGLFWDKKKKSFTGQRNLLDELKDV